MGTLDLQVPKVREGSYFPSLLEPRRRSERALLAVVQQAYVEGVSTRRVENLVQALGCEGISKSQVSRICSELDAVVDSFLGRPLDGGPYPYLWLDALTQKVREDGRIVNVSVAVATGVNREGKREVLGIDVGTSDGPGLGWGGVGDLRCASGGSSPARAPESRGSRHLKRDARMVGMLDDYGRGGYLPEPRCGPEAHRGSFALTTVHDPICIGVGREAPMPMAP